MRDSIEEYVKRFRQKVTPAMRCYHPLRIYNANRGEFEWHNCGKCPYCLKMRSDELTQRCYKESEQHPYAIFFTLTYDNEHIPYLERVGKWWILRNRKEVVDGESTVIIHDSEVQGVHPIESNECPIDIECFGVLWKQDIINFKKRLFINLKRYVQRNKKYYTSLFVNGKLKEEPLFRIFVNGEYGPTTLRPHYHGILWFDDKCLANDFLDSYKDSSRASDRDYWHGLIYESWAMCSPDRCDSQHVTKAAPSYVASYVCSTYSLPDVLQAKPFRPKVLASKNPIIGSYKVSREILTDALFNGTILYPQWDDDEKSFTEYPLPYTYFTRYFPRCEAYSVSDINDKLSIFAKYESGRYVKRQVVRRGYFDLKKQDKSCLDFNQEYKDTPYNDYYRYQNSRFHRMLKYWCSRSFDVPERDDLGKLTGRFVSCKLSPRQYIECLDRLYSNMELYKLSKFYAEQEELLDGSRNTYNEYLFTNRYQAKIYLLTYYPEFVHSLPRVLAPAVNRFELNRQLNNFGLGISDIYNGLELSPAFFDFFFNNSIAMHFRVNTTQKCIDRNKSKKYKEFYARQKGIIY